MNGWIDIRVSRPAHYQDVLFVCSDGYMGVETYYPFEDQRESLYYGDREIRYWIPIPDIDSLDGVTKDLWIQRALKEEQGA